MLAGEEAAVETNTVGDHAVVLGGSMAGLLAARALADAYDRVTVVERDELPESAEPRRGVPQARHIHGLIARGQQALEELFPGLTDDLAGRGAPTLDQLRDARLYFQSAHRFPQAESGVVVLSVSRPFLEAHVRALVRSLPDATGLFRLRPDVLAGDQAVIVGPTPPHRRGAGLARIEGQRHIVTLMGMLGERPPTDLPGFLDFAKSLPVSDIYEAIVDAELLDGLNGFRFPASVRRHYERMPRFPDGLLVVGDAVCSLNPIYGQGMSLAAIEALVLRKHLASGEPSPRRVMRDVAAAIDAAWDMTIGADLAFPGVEGHRSVKVRLANAYVPRLHAASSHDSALATGFLKVAGLVERPEALFRPGVVARVLRHSVRSR